MNDFTLRLDTLSPQPTSEETKRMGTEDPVDLSHFDPWLREMDSGCSCECETPER